MNKNNSFELSSRGWLVLFFEAAESNGIYPITMDMLHKLIYLANVLSPIFNVIMPNSYTLKNRRGPYFPRAQFDIGILTAQRLVESKNIKSFKDDYGFWLRAEYRITRHGLEIAKETSDSFILENYSMFLKEFFRALTYLSDRELNEISDYDLHYKIALDGFGVDISTPDNNISIDAVENLFPANRFKTPREGIHRYVSYLKNVHNKMEDSVNER
ncbi:TPA: hypothetical protein KNH08_003561 [Serratia fonticola]|nr:hypothetical protein [Serratia fonticola]